MKRKRVSNASSTKRYSKPSKILPVSRTRIIDKKAKFLIWTTLFGIILAIIYWLYFSNFFLVNEIRLAERDIAQEDLASQIQAVLQDQIGENLISIDVDELTRTTKEKFPEIETIKLSKNYPKTIEIQFNQFPLVANVVHESANVKKNYIINSVGRIMKEDFENPSLPDIYIYEEEPANPKVAIIDANKLLYILESVIYFEDKFGMQINSVEYLRVAREIHLRTERDFEIWLDIQVGIDDQLKKLKKAVVKLDIYNESLEYIDLRIAGANGDKIIYRRK